MIKSFSGKSPVIDESVFVAENAAIIGNVTIGKGSSVWYSAVLRADMCPITIGENSNIAHNVYIKKDSKIWDNSSILPESIITGIIKNQQGVFEKDK